MNGTNGLRAVIQNANAPLFDAAGDPDTLRDSLTLGQLRRLVAQTPRPKLPLYAYKYEDTDSLKAELQEWFSYGDNEILLEAKQEYEGRYGVWSKSSIDTRSSYIDDLLQQLQSSEQADRIHAGMLLLYVVGGVFGESTAPEHQFHWITENARHFHSRSVFYKTYQSFRNTCEIFWESATEEDDFSQEASQKRSSCRLEMVLHLTVMYFMLEVLRTDQSFRDGLYALQPAILPYFIEMVGILRWKSGTDYPIFLVLWKTILAMLGGRTELLKTKEYARRRAGLPQELPKDIITASPLDYHIYRQEVISKYPSCQPPPPCLPIDFDATTITPSYTDYASRPKELPLLNNTYLATPMPSAAPSPSNSPKLKKQSFQTDQNMPFLFPITDEINESIPFSIKEAGELFHSRLNMSLATFQLWKEQDIFLKTERGWIDPVDDESENKDDSPEAIKLRIVEETYKSSLPHLQSCVVVLLKVLLAAVNVPQLSPIQEDAEEGGESQGRLTLDEIDDIRTREVTMKAISGIILLLLKWFRVSHVLKFEFLSQLLVDSRCPLLLLKVFGLQDLSTSIIETCEMKESNFFQVCSNHSQNCHSPINPQQSEPELLKPNGGIAITPSTTDEDQTLITEYSSRLFFTSINFLRILQKLVKKKAHRNLILVQYKSWQILRKPLKVAQDDLRLYVLKITKGQIPYCGRKWRSSNMRVITSIYLHCRPDLREDWLSGLDVEADIDDALPQEHALRAVIEGYNVRRYPSGMKALGYHTKLERDFFEEQIAQMSVQHDNEDIFMQEDKCEKREEMGETQR
ncbi:Factor arrest protein 11 [Neolecta irregularis DAH-3]|uniref:Factor arrest protein 11 n=1 Tax=Neolecta irregularis (strain DAH-3) TaxID=1198029 RepID=A0A1U7LI81_NEOID|nr:Factor arrest protein 11 [Neolecta irregularis DAH-3]|eukprot:OLL22366.1 Factor arrest protein 11 [Neolecta irregularis DAH-3]